jgi:hypothetical protein
MILESNRLYLTANGWRARVYHISATMCLGGVTLADGTKWRSIHWWRDGRSVRVRDRRFRIVDFWDELDSRPASSLTQKQMHLQMVMRYGSR